MARQSSPASSECSPSGAESSFEGLLELSDHEGNEFPSFLHGDHVVTIRPTDDWRFPLHSNLVNGRLAWMLGRTLASCRPVLLFRRSGVVSETGPLPEARPDLDAILTQHEMGVLAPVIGDRLRNPVVQPFPDGTIIRLAHIGFRDGRLQVLFDVIVAGSSLPVVESQAEIGVLRRVTARVTETASVVKSKVAGIFQPSKAAVFQPPLSTDPVESKFTSWRKRVGSALDTSPFFALFVRLVLYSSFLGGSFVGLGYVWTMFYFGPALAVGGYTILVTSLVKFTSALYQNVVVRTVLGSVLPFAGSAGVLLRELARAQTMGILDIADLVTLVIHGVDVFATGATRVTYVLHLAIRFFRVSGIDVSSMSKLHSNSLQAQVGIEDLTSTAAAILGVGSDRDTRDKLLMFNARASAMRSIGAATSLAVEFYNWVMDANDHKAEFERYCTEATSVLRDPPKSYPPAVIDRLKRLQSEGKVLREKMAVGTPELRRAVPAAFLGILAEYTSKYAIWKTHFESGGDRPRPFTVLIKGPAGTGKSELLKLLRNFALVRMHPGSQLADVKHDSYTYSKNANARCDGLSDQKVFIFDDLCQAQNADDNLQESQLFCRIASSDEYFSDQAEMANKRQLARPYVVLATTNQDIHEQAKIGLVDTMAVLRRPDLIVRPRPFAKPKANPTLADFPDLEVTHRLGVRVAENISPFELIDTMFRSIDQYIQNHAGIGNQYDTSFQQFTEWKNAQAPAVAQHFASGLTNYITERIPTSWTDSVSAALDSAGVATLVTTISPRRRAVAASLAALLVVLLVVFFFIKKKKPEREPEEDEDLEVEAHYLTRDRPPRKRKPPKSHALEAQVATNSQVTQVTYAVVPNIGVMTIHVPGGDRHTNFVSLSGSNILINEHPFVSIPQKTWLTYWRPNSTVDVLFSECQFVRVASDAMILWHEKFPVARNIIKHFPPRAQLPLAKGRLYSPGMFIVRDKPATDHLLRNRFPSYFYETARLPQHLDGQELDIILDGHFEFPVETDAGHCGGLYFNCDPKSGAPILAFHAASRGPGRGIGVFVAREDLQANLFRRDAFDVLTDDELEAQSGIAFVDTPRSFRLSEEAPLGFFHVGQSKETSFMSQKSKFVPSPLQKDVLPTTAPPHMTSWTQPDGTVVNPADYFFSKQHVPVPIDPEVFPEVSKFEQYVIPAPAPQFTTSWLSEHEMLNGVHGTSLHPVRYQSSAGFRLRKLCAGHGKLPYLQVDHTDSGTVLSCSPQARAELDAMLIFLESCTPLSAFADAQKDERYEFSKANKYRIVSTDDVREFLMYRILFGPFLEALRRFFPFGNSQVGIDAMGPDFHLLVTFIRQMNDRAMDLDIMHFDIAVPYEARREFYRLSIAWNRLHFPREDPVWNTRRANYARRVLQHVHLFLDWAYVRVGGTCSGVGGTAEENGEVNRLLNKVAALHITGRSDFDSYVRAAYYGDDFLATVHPSVPELNKITYAVWMKKNLGITCTNPSKTPIAERDVPLVGAQFISRTIARLDDRFDVFVGRLDEDTIKEIALWIRPTDQVDSSVLFRQNCESSLREMLYHGRDAFESWSATVNKRLSLEGMSPVELTYDGLLADYLSKY